MTRDRCTLKTKVSMSQETMPAALENNEAIGLRIQKPHAKSNTRVRLAGFAVHLALRNALRTVKSGMFLR